MPINRVVSTLADQQYVNQLERKLEELIERIERLESTVIELRKSLS